MSSVSVLVVEDFAPFQRFISSTLKKSPDLQVIGVVSDGLEAVQKAEECPTGPDCARHRASDIGWNRSRLEEFASYLPNPKCSLSQESSADVVQEGLHSGALGYVAKTRAGIHLLAAVEAICQGRRFVSAGLVDQVPVELADRQASNRFQPCFASQPEAGG